MSASQAPLRSATARWYTGDEGRPMVDTTTSPGTTTPACVAAAEPAARPTIVFRRGAVTVRAVPEAKGWRVEGDDPGLVERIAAALRRPMRTRVSREAVDECSGAFQIETWMAEIQPDDPRYAIRVAYGPHRVGLDAEQFDDIDLRFPG